MKIFTCWRGWGGDARRSSTLHVGVGLLAKAVGQPTLMVNVMASS